MTPFGRLNLNQIQVQCKKCGSKKNITRELFGIKSRILWPEDTIKRLALIGALSPYRVSEKVCRYMGCKLNKTTVWRSVQKVGEKINFSLDEKEKAVGEADGTGIGIQGIKNRGKEIKVFVQLKKYGGIRVAGLSVDNYKKGWDKLFSPLISTMKRMKDFMLITDGETGIFNSIKNSIEIHFQRCLWHIPHQTKYYLWKDNLSRKSNEYKAIITEIIDICNINKISVEREDEHVLEDIISKRESRFTNLINHCKWNYLDNTARYLENAENDFLTYIKNRIEGKTTSHAERVMRTINMRAKVGKWSEKGALNLNRIRLAHYYNGFDVE